ncbi:hypothetical protein R4L22_00415 [Brachyspira pilosicoli]|uniref:hypothetical protein n=1 Tax=Brachyspira pilosicoli TaxID=52584 RepID=UPI0012F51F52|nr:hypothetical protein [Brachyspira pilosicoli]
MQKQIKIFSTLLTVLVLAVSCANTNPNDPTKTKEEMLQQKWQYDNFEGGYDIKADRVDDWAGTAVNYSVAIKEIFWNKDNTSGIIYGQYTIAPSYNPSVANKYYAISFKGLTDSAVSICGASKQLADGSYDSSAESLEEAKTKFTEANGYFGSYSDCIAVK